MHIAVNMWSRERELKKWRKLIKLKAPLDRRTTLIKVCNAYNVELDMLIQYLSKDTSKDMNANRRLVLKWHRKLSWLIFQNRVIKHC